VGFRLLISGALALLSATTVADDPLRWGVTTDDPWNGTARQAAALAALPERPALRVVFDEHVDPDDYRAPLEALGAVATIMGELLDSSAATEYDDGAYRRRLDAYLDTLWPLVDVWEIGNEVNGEWAGTPESQARRIAWGLDAVEARGGMTALTLYANMTCAEEPEHELFAWVATWLDDGVRARPDYVLLSWWPDDCPGTPDWPATFDRLGRLFPHAKLGLGENGIAAAAAKPAQAAWCYAPGIDHPRYIGGCFWWYFRTEMVPAGTPTWQALADAMARD